MFSALVGIEPIDRKFAFARGTMVDRYLSVHYYNRMHPKQLFEKLLCNMIYWISKFQKETGMSQDDAYTLVGTLIAYRNEYKNETWTPVAVQAGFSKTLFEDTTNLFVYEGAIDLIAYVPAVLAPVDHKTEAAKRPIYEYNNQALGYSWALDASTFVYNYLTLTKKPGFHRAVHTFTPLKIQDWISDTIEWCFRIKHSIQNTSFLKSRRCDGKYGKCEFTKICEQPKTELKQYIIGANYKRRRPYRSW